MHITLFPWQANCWRDLWRSWQNGRLPHALLFSGMPGTGKKIFTTLFVRALFCLQVDKEGHPCQRCQPCHWLQTGVHPDVLWVEPEKEGQAIKVDQIRTVIEFSQKTALQGAYRVVVICPASNMNINAANALLKTLEEPSAQTIMILVSHEDQKLPMTILSRCQRVVFQNPAHDLARAWLAPQLPANANSDLLLMMTQGAPLSALNLHTSGQFALRCELFDALIQLSQQRGDPLASAAKWQNTEILHLMDYFFSFLLDLLRLQQASTIAPLNSDYEQSLKQLSQSLSSEQVLHYVDYLQQIRRHMVQSFNLNKQLLLEDLLLRWNNLYATR